MSRREADKLIAGGKIAVNNQPARVGQIINEDDVIKLNGKKLELKFEKILLMLNKPAGYICSRKGQGSKTIYNLLPQKYHHLKPVGRLDKDTSGLLLITNDGELANKLAHPRYQKEKVYHAALDKPLAKNGVHRLLKGVKLGDGLSKFVSLKLLNNKTYEVKIAEGRNRQIRRSFAFLGRKVITLRRVRVGKYRLGSLGSGEYVLLG